MSVLILKKNELGRDFVIGDIHGEFSMLEAMLREIGFNPARDRLLCCGDLIDRGSESHRAFEFLEQPWFFSVKGNHEDAAAYGLMDIKANKDNLSEATLHWLRHGGMWVYGLHEHHFAFMSATLNALPVLIEMETVHGKIGVCHGEPPLGAIWDDMKQRVCVDAEYARELLWGRHRMDWIAQREDAGLPPAPAEPEEGFGVKGVDHLFMGHTIVKKWMQLENLNYIDVGAFFYKKMLLINLSHAEGFQVFSASLEKITTPVSGDVH